MKHSFKITLLSVLAALQFTCGLIASPTNVYIKFKNSNNFSIDRKNNNKLQQFSGNNSENINNLIKSFNIQDIQSTFKIKDARFKNHFTIELKDTAAAVQFVEKLKNNSEVEYIEIEPEYQTYYTPNDLQKEQWNLFKINAEAAWDFGKGSKQITIAIVDDAVKIDHDDLKDNIWVNKGEIPDNGIDDDGNGYIDDINGWDAADNENNPNPPNYADVTVFSHGTHCAGIASAVTDNGTGIASIGNNVSIIAVKCKADGTDGGSLTAVMQGLQYAIIAGADVISMSWGSNSYSQTMQDIFNYAYEKGILLIAAAGNDNSAMKFYPSACDHVISVGASTQSDNKASFSNYGDAVDVMAPGYGILSTIAGNQKYAFYSGTSMACPLVAGLAAYMKSLNPTLKPDDIELCLKSTADNIDGLNPGYEGKLGAGRINALNAVICSKTGPPIADFNSNLYNVCPMQPITFYDISKGTYETYRLWRFPGGIPDTSFNPIPIVMYPESGQYDVILISCNQHGCDTIIKKGYITIDHPRAKLSNFGFDSICEGSHALVKIELTGTAPWTLGWRNGSEEHITVINDSIYYLEVYPKRDSTIELLSVKDKFNCIGSVSGKANFTFINCTGMPPRNDVVWYFGLYAGLDFIQGKPVPLLNSAMSTYEGCASYCDKKGNLLFYTDGISVWNKEHKLMPDGIDLKGNQSSSQSALIVPKPGSTNLLYIFTTDCAAITIPTNGLRYSVVDMNLDSGRGDIIEKNTFLVALPAEKVTGCRHKNGVDAWIITKTWGDNKFYAYLLTKNGIEDTVITEIGEVFEGGNPEASPAHGYISVSPNGSKLAVSLGFRNAFELLDFDNKTGTLSNSKLFSFASGFVYGLEFSPDNSKLYVATHISQEIYQYDISSNDQVKIKQSETLIKHSNKYFDALELGPDGKIYVAQSAFNTAYGYVGVINKPNDSGIACDFVEDGVYLEGRQEWAGLPNILKDFYVKGINAGIDDTVCLYSSIRLNPKLDSTIPGCSYFWNPETGLDNPYIPNPIATPMQTTIYTITVMTPDGDRLTDSVTVFVREDCCTDGTSPIADFQLNNPICIGDTIYTQNLSKFGENAKFEWYFGENANNQGSYDFSPNIVYKSEGVYNVRLIVVDSCGRDTAIRQITVYPKPVAKAGPDLDICVNETELGTISIGDSSLSGFEYSWTPEEYLSNPHISKPSIIKPYEGRFILKVTSLATGCIDYDTVNVNISPNVESVISDNVEICDGDTTILSASGGDTYQWSPSEGLSSMDIPNPAAYPNKTTTYKVIVSKNGYCSDTAYVKVIVKHKNNYLIYLENNGTNYAPGDIATITAYIKNLNYKHGIFTKKFGINVQFNPQDLSFVPRSIKKVSAPDNWILDEDVNQKNATINITAQGNTDYGNEFAFSMDFLVLFRSDIMDTIPLAFSTNFEANENYCINNPDSIKIDKLGRQPLCAEQVHNVLMSDILFNLGSINPNPVNKNLVQLDYTIGFDANTRITIYNSYGQTVSEPVNVFQKTGKYSVDINLSGFVSGVYFYKMTSGPYTEVKSFVIE